MKTSSHLELGAVYTRAELEQRFEIHDATLKTGIFRPKGHDSVWLFITIDKTADRTQYGDRLEGDELWMEGQTKRRKDALLIGHESSGLELLLFLRKSRFEFEGAGFRYEGQYRYVSHEEGQPGSPTRFHLRRAQAAASAAAPGHTSSLMDIRVHSDDGVALDATFGVVASENQMTITMNSRGGRRGDPDARNLDYLPALELLLTRLRRLDATLLLAAVDTSRTRHLPLQDRVVGAPAYSFPIRLGEVDDIAALRIALTEGQRHVGQRPGARGSNNTKRLSLQVRVTEPDGDWARFARELAGRTDAAAASTATEVSIESIPVPPEESLVAAEEAPPARARLYPNRSAPEPAQRVSAAARPDAALGLAGELWVVRWERRRLTEAGRADLAARVVHTSAVVGDGLGYDIASFEADGADRAIEVKTTRGNDRAPFFVTQCELQTAERMGHRWCLYRVFNFGLRPRLYVVRGSLKDAFSLEAVAYKARR